MSLTGIARVYAITVDTDMDGLYPDGEVEQEWLTKPSDDEEAMILLAGPLAELKCIANHEQTIEWTFHDQTTISGIAENNIDVSATFQTVDGTTSVIAVGNAPFETDFGQVRKKADSADVIAERVKLTQAWLDDPPNWEMVKKLANALIGLKGKPVLRRQLFGPQVTKILK